MNRSQTRLALLGWALSLGLLIVVLGNLAMDIVVSGSFFDGGLGSIDVPGAILQVMSTSLPMIALALWGTRSRLLWATAILMTIGFWVYFVIQIRQDSLNDFAGGANIGLGLIMIFSPFFILVCLLVLGLVARRARRR